MSDFHANALHQALSGLTDHAGVHIALSYIREHVDRLNTELKEEVLCRVPGFSESGNPDVLPDLAAHALQHTDEILRLLSGGQVAEFQFVREHAQRRAEQRFPLEYTLHAYRCGHKVYSQWLRESVLAATETTADAQTLVAAIADFSIEYTDCISTLFASAYLARSQLLADVTGDRRMQLLSLLLDGYDESDSGIARILRDAGYIRSRQSYCVALIQSVDPTEMHSPDRARRLADSIDRLFVKSSIKRIIDLRHNKVVAVFSDVRRRSGWTAPSTTLATIVSEELLRAGISVLTGVSNDVPSTAGIPTAYREAQHAFELANRSHRVMQFSSISAHQLLEHLAGEEFQRVLPAWTEQFCEIDRKQSGELYRTLCAYADADMNAIKTAEHLRVHANTIYARFQRISEITGLQPRSYHSLTDLLILLNCANRREITSANERSDTN